MTVSCDARDSCNSRPVSCYNVAGMICRLTKSLLLVALLILLPSLSHAESKGKLILDATFDDADLSGWRIAGDVCVAPAFCAGTPSRKYWVAMSTNSDKDSITLCGGSSVGGMQSILRTPDLTLPPKTRVIQVDFKVKFLTNESTSAHLGNDTLIARIVTTAGPVVIAAFDDSGASPGTSNLSIEGDSTFHESECTQNWRYETGMLQVSYYRTFRDPFLSRMTAGPVALEFVLENQFDQDFNSAAVIDDVQIRVFP